MADKRQQKRIFVNDVDQYSSKNIAEFLSAYTEEEEVEEEEEALEDVGTFAPAGGGDAPFQVVGTVSASSGTAGHAAGLYQHYTSPTREALLDLLMECDVVVYNISEGATQEKVEEAKWAFTSLYEDMASFPSRKQFILVSSVMTWVMTKPQDPEDLEFVLSEEEFRRRRPHPSYKDQHQLEKLVLKLARGKKSKLIGYVVGGGFQYGRGENLFHYFFKVSWSMQFPKVPIFGTRANFLPMIHVYDLAGVIQNIIELKPRSKYILAIDDSKNTLEEVVEAISNILGPGDVDFLPVQEAIDTKAFKPEELVCLNVDLRLEAFIVKDVFNLEWVYENGMVENMERIVQEYKSIRHLQQVKICLLGPPAVGKSTVARELCRLYQLHHITLKDIVQDKIAELENIVNTHDDDESVSRDEVAAAQLQLEDIEKNKNENEGRLGEHPLYDFLLDKLLSRPCQNQGFVLDGFPRTYKEAQTLFPEINPENLHPDVLMGAPVYNTMITPDHVFALEAPEDFLIRRVQQLPESPAESNRYTQDAFQSRLEKYRQLNASEDTSLSYFDELEIHPEHIAVTTDDLEYTDVMDRIRNIVGPAKNYGLSPEEQEKEDRKKKARDKLKQAAKACESRCRKEAQLSEMTTEYEDWMKKLLEVKRQEDELLEARALPLRDYLMKHVMPSLSAAMVDCSQIKPEDPVDFLVSTQSLNASICRVVTQLGLS